MTILATWDGDGFAPIGRYKKTADADYVVGQTYTLDVILERSGNSHRHFMATVHDLWLTLPENIADQYPSADHLRKKALIRAGYADERSIVCASKAEAQRVAAFIRPMDTYAIVTVKDAVVRVYTAKSQSYRAMDKGEFQKSKEAVLDIIVTMIGVAKKQIEDAA